MSFAPTRRATILALMLAMTITILPRTSASADPSSTRLHLEVSSSALTVREREIASLDVSVVDQDEMLVPAQPIHADIFAGDDAGDTLYCNPNNCATGVDGKVAIFYYALAEGESTLRFWVDLDGNNMLGPGEPSTTADLRILRPRGEGLVALGDSYSAGEGAGTPDNGVLYSDDNRSFNYLSETNTSTNKCHRSTNAYPMLLGGQVEYAPLSEVTFRACSGAVTTDLVEANPNNSDEVAQVAAVTPNTTVATFSAGGNDVGFGEVLEKCTYVSQNGVYLPLPDKQWGPIPPVKGRPGCTTKETFTSLYESRVGALAKNPAEGSKNTVRSPEGRRIIPIGELVKSIRTGSQGNAEIYVIGYPRLFAPSKNTTKLQCNIGSVNVPNIGRVDLSVRNDDSSWINSMTDNLNSTLRDKVQALSDGGARIHFVDPTEKFGRFGLCGGRASMINWLQLDENNRAKPFSIHPNARGQQAYADAVSKVMVKDDTLPPFITTERLSTAHQGEPFNGLVAQADSRRGRWKVAAGSLPSGLALDPKSGALYGIPDSAGVAQFTLRFTDRQDRKTQRQFRLIVQAPGELSVPQHFIWNRIADLGTANWSAVECPAAETCLFKRDNNSYSLLDAGSIEARPAVDPTYRRNPQPHCPSAEFCYGWNQGQLLLSQNYRDFQKTVAMPFETDGVWTVGCLDAMHCSAGSRDRNGTYRTYLWNGTEWTEVTEFSSPFPEYVACVSSAFCAGGQNQYPSTFDGTVWKQLDSARSGLVTGVACGSRAIDCIVGTDSGDVFEWDGDEWASRASVDPSWNASPITGTSCVENMCVVAESSNGIRQRLGGQWIERGAVQVDSSDKVVGISCPTASRCYALAQSGAVFEWSGALS